eukprot:scaffold12676_cov112-Isochrysis_galbana.AAC.11
MCGFAGVSRDEGRGGAAATAGCCWLWWRAASRVACQKHPKPQHRCVCGLRARSAWHVHSAACMCRCECRAAHGGGAMRWSGLLLVAGRGERSARMLSYLFRFVVKNKAGCSSRRAALGCAALLFY